MKKIFNFLLILAMTASIFSCKKKDVAPLPVAEFTFAPNTGRSPITVTFTNTSLNATTYAWDFSGGAATSTEKNPVVNFTTGGTFAVTLTATGDGGVTKVTKSITLLPPLTASEKIIGKYRITLATETSGGVTTNVLDPCTADNTVDFLATGQTVTNYLGVACFPGEPVTDSDPYFLSADGTKMTLGSGTNAFVLDIIELTTSVIRLRVDAGQGSTRNITFTRI